MSGHKRATVTAQANNIRQLSQTEMAIRFVEAGLSELSERLDYYAQEGRDAEASQTEIAQQVLLQTLTEVDEVFGQLEQETQYALAAQENQFFDQLNLLNETVQAENSERYEDLSKQYQAALDEVNNQNEASVQMISDRLDMQAKNRLDNRQNIRKWISASTILFNTLSDDPFTELINPESLDGCVDLINQAKDNYRAGFLDASLVCAQNAYREISKARIQIGQQRHQYETLSHLYDKKLKILEQEIELNRKVPVFDLHGNPLKNEIEVDDWVGGNLTRLEQKIIQAQSLLSQPISNRKLEKMKHAVGHLIPRWESRLNNYVFQARSDAINSQLRMNIALMVVRALSKQGYKLVQSKYDNEDMRSDYQAHLIDGEGSQVLIQVEPAGSRPEAAEVNLYTQDADKRTPHELRQRSMEIQRSLRQAGLNIGDFKPVQPEHQPEKLLQVRGKDEQQHEQQIPIFSKR